MVRYTKKTLCGKFFLVSNSTQVARLCARCCCIKSSNKTCKVDLITCLCFCFWVFCLILNTFEIFNKRLFWDLHYVLYVCIHRLYRQKYWDAPIPIPLVGAGVFFVVVIFFKCVFFLGKSWCYNIQFWTTVCVWPFPLSMSMPAP